MPRRKMVGSFVGTLDNDKAQVFPATTRAAPPLHKRVSSQPILGSFSRRSRALLSHPDTKPDHAAQAFVRKVASAAGPLPSDMLLSDADALIAAGDLAAAAAALQVSFRTRARYCTRSPLSQLLTPPALQKLMEEQPEMVHCSAPPRVPHLLIVRVGG